MGIQLAAGNVLITVWNCFVFCRKHGVGGFKWKINNFLEGREIIAPDTHKKATYILWRENNVYKMSLMSIKRVSDGKDGFTGDE